MALYNDQCLRSVNGKSSTSRIEVSDTVFATGLSEGGLRRRTSSRQMRYSSGGRDWRRILRDVQPIMPSQRESLSSLPKEDRRA